MSVKDSKYTSPDALREQYRNPRNPLQNVEDITQVSEFAAIASAVDAASTTPESIGPAGGEFIQTGFNKFPSFGDEFFGEFLE